MKHDALNNSVFKKHLENYAKERKEQINTRGMLSFLREDSTVIVAPLRSFDASPATNLPRGVDSAYAYIDSPERGIPAGFYTLRVSAKTVQLGTVPGTLEFVDTHGKIARRSDIQIDITSLTLPEQPAFPHSIVSMGNQDTHAASLQADLVIVCCPKNGYCWFER